MTLLYPITSWLSVVTREAMQRCREEARAGRVCRALIRRERLAPEELWGTQSGSKQALLWDPHSGGKGPGPGEPE